MTPDLVEDGQHVLEVLTEAFEVLEGGRAIQAGSDLHERIGSAYRCMAALCESLEAASGSERPSAP